MVIKLPDGTTIIETGDPSFESVEDLGANSPTNFILDPDPDKPVTQFILETYNIPFQANTVLGRVLGGSLPGFDIRNQDATTMMKLSLAVELRNGPIPASLDLAGASEFAEVELDEFGVARFYVVGQEAAQNLEIRYCIPTSQIRNPADLVIVRGYDPPPRRELRTSFDGLKNAEIFTYEECAAGSCDENAVGKFASISYDDPLLDQVYLDDVVNSYELAAFESLIGYVIDLDLPSGTDPDFSADRGIKITFGDTTKEYISVSAELLQNFVTIGVTSPGNDFAEVTGFGGTTGAADEGAVFGNVANGNATTLTVTSVDPQTGECSTEVTSIVGSKITIPASRFTRLNKFGREESDFMGVVDVVFTGRKIVAINALTGFFVTAFVKPLKELISLQVGKNWTYTVTEDGDVDIELFSILEDSYSASICNLYKDPPGPPTSLVRRSTASPNSNEAVGGTAFTGFICSIGDRLGYMIVNNSLCIVVERKRPSIDIFDPNGNAEAIARQFLQFQPADPGTGGVYHDGNFIPGVIRTYGVRYTPIVIVDEPAPIAYAATAALQSIDAQTGQPGANILPSTGIIDQADGIVDADPSTTQDFGESEIQILQDNTNGATIDITLPFCTEQECLEIAQNFLALQSQIVDTQSIVLGPNSTPRLGDFLPDGSIINEINYSYSDGSQYLITITSGPKYLTAGSFQDSRYQLQTEEVTREGVVVQDRGNGAEYVVRVDGFGELNCLSMVLDEITVGDKVSVGIRNHPVEHF